jgi:hypothetical protein
LVDGGIVKDISETRYATLLIVEAGAEWPSWTAKLHRRAPENLVETQLAGESAEAFEERLLRRLDRLALSRVRLTAAGYVAARGPGRQASRERLCEAVLARMTGDAELVVAGGSWATTGVEGRERAALFTLWSTLSERSTTQLISIRFNDEASDSGVFRAIPVAGGTSEKLSQAASD